jgi:sulfonate transport system substrate-binding protein
MKRRQFLAQAALGVGVSILGGAPAFPQALREFRIGYQKNGVLVIARQQAALEKRYRPAATIGTT